MRCHLLTKNLFCSLLCFGLLSVNGDAFAQVYKSYDADGNVVYSDKPSQRSQEVEIGQPNVSDTFEIPPPPADPPPETEPAAPAADAETQPIADDDSADTNNDGRISRREKEEYRKAKRKKNREKAEAVDGSNE